MASKQDSSMAVAHLKFDKFLAESQGANLSKKGNEIGEGMVAFLKKNSQYLENYPEIANYVEALGSHWVNSPNVKVSIFGLECLMIIAENLRGKFKNICNPVFPNVIHHLGSFKEALREKSRIFLVKTVEVGASTSSLMIEKLMPLLSSKNKDMAIESQRTIRDVLLVDRHQKIAPKLLLELLNTVLSTMNTNITMRDEVSPVIVQISERMGKSKVLEILTTLTKKSGVLHQKKLQSLIEEISNLSIEQASTPADEEDTFDFAVPKPKPLKPLQAAAPAQKPKSKLMQGGAIPKTTIPRPKLGEGEKYALYSGGKGEADEAWFLNAFQDVPNINCSNHKEFEQLTKKMVDDLKGGAEFWEKKVEALRKLRSLVINYHCEEDILGFLKQVSLDLVSTLKDLRSQVVRETCLTFAFLCKELKNKVEAHSCEIVMAQLMTNLMSSAKVIVSASFIAMKFMLTHVHHSRLINSLISTMNHSKSREVRTAACEFIELILIEWPVNRLEQQLAVLQDGIKKGMTESSTDGRFAARRAYWLFNERFPEQGEALMNSVDIATKKALQKIAPAHKLVSTIAKPTTLPRLRLESAGARKPAAQLMSLRSTSAIDVYAAKRAKEKYSPSSKISSGIASLPRSSKKELSAKSSHSSSSSSGFERIGRTKSRVSQSQPGSRSGSPSSRLGYQTYNVYDITRGARRKVEPGSVGSSRDTSREASPNRYGSKSATTLFLNKRSRLGGLGRERPPVQSSTPVLAQKMLAQSLEAENLPLTGEMYDGDGADSLGHKISPRKTSYRPFEDHSDDSDASSLCSERSFDSYRRTSDDIMEIIANCESIHWSDRKEGLVALQSYLQSGNTLNSSELKRVTDLFTRMFMDSHTKVFSLFLDSLNEIILVHRADLNSWLYVLLTRLLNKLGVDLLPSIQNKILKSLDVVRESFPTELQMASVLRFLTDPTQTPNLRVKTTTLTYITKLAAITDPSQAFPPSSHPRDPVQAALHKMIGWTMGDSIKQGNELRRASQEAILALFNLNTPQVTLRLASLPQEYQEAAATLLRGRVRRGSSSSGGGTTTNSPPSPSPRLTSPAPTLQRHFCRTHDADALNPEEIYRSLRKTTAEIQNYTYETGSEKPPDKDNTTSKDSGISQLSGIEPLEETMEDLSLQSGPSSHASIANRVLTVRDCNGVDTTDSPSQDDGPVDEHEAMRKIVEALKSPPDSDNGENISIMSESEKRATLGQLTRLIRESSVTVLEENFKAILRILLGNLALDLNTRDVQTRILVLTALTELIKKRAMTDYFNHYVELLILKVLNCYKDTSKEVVRNAESCANTIAMTLAPQMVIRVLAPVIQTGEYPLNLAAIKMLTKLVECCGKDPVFKYLPDLMPGLIQAYDNQESTVRKSAVFCMVSLHAAIGDEGLKPHLAALNGSKLKLLHLYIRRSQQGSSTPTSPRNHPQASSS